MANHLESLTIACACECSQIKYMEHSHEIDVSLAITRAYEAGWRQFDTYEDVRFTTVPHNREVLIEINASCPACVFAILSQKKGNGYEH